MCKTNVHMIWTPVRCRSEYIYIYICIYNVFCLLCIARLHVTLRSSSGQDTVLSQQWPGFDSRTKNTNVGGAFFYMSAHTSSPRTAAVALCCCLALARAARVGRAAHQQLVLGGALLSLLCWRPLVCPSPASFDCVVASMGWLPLRQVYCVPMMYHSMSSWSTR